MSIFGLNGLTRVYKSSKRVARGFSSGTGKTAGRGHKGQKSRSGVSVRLLYGKTGQNPLYRSIPKHHFNSHLQRFGKPTQEVTISRIVLLIESGKLGLNISKSDFVSAGLIRDDGSPVKLISSSCECKKNLTIEVDFASAGAIKSISSAGGKVILAKKVDGLQ